MTDPVQTMPTNDTLCNENFTPRQWLLYYKNIWTRNLIARTIDVQTDVVLKSKTPDERVQGAEGNIITAKERLEERKMIVQDALNLIEAIDFLLAIPEEEFEAKTWSKEALAVAEDMIQKPAEAPKEGDMCMLPDGRPGTLKKEGDSFVCIPNPAPAVGEPAPADEAKPTEPTPAPEQPKA